MPAVKVHAAASPTAAQTAAAGRLDLEQERPRLPCTTASESESPPVPRHRTLPSGRDAAPPKKTLPPSARPGPAGGAHCLGRQFPSRVLPVPGPQPGRPGRPGPKLVAAAGRHRRAKFGPVHLLVGAGLDLSGSDYPSPLSESAIRVVRDAPQIIRAENPGPYPSPLSESDSSSPSHRMRAARPDGIDTSTAGRPASAVAATTK